MRTIPENIFVLAVFVLGLGTYTTPSQTVELSALSLIAKDSCYPDTNTKGISKLTCQNIGLEFRNNGSAQIIIINPTLNYGTGLKEVMFYYTDYDREERKWKIVGKGKVTVPQNPENVKNFQAMSQFFDGDRPPENMTITLQPKETFSFKDFVFVDLPRLTIEPEKILETRDPATAGVIKRIIPARTLEPSCFRLVYEYSFLPYFSDPDMLDRVSQKWKRYGTLPIGTNGAYTVTSEMMSPCRIE